MRRHKDETRESLAAGAGSWGAVAQRVSHWPHSSGGWLRLCIRLHELQHAGLQRMVRLLRAGGAAR